MCTSLLERFCAPLCDVLLAEASQPPHSVHLLARLERANLFVVALDSAHYWYRYHHLFQQLLLHHLQRQVSPTCLSHLHRRAGEWLVCEGLIEEALRHLLAAGEVDVAAALVERHFRALIDNGVHSGKDLERWVALFQWDYRRIEALLAQADAVLQGRESRSTRDVAGNIVLKIFDHRQNRIRRCLAQTANRGQGHSGRELFNQREIRC
jgi:LuxR family transcriptional regulator, maltose regulon positive regulatory protein